MSTYYVRLTGDDGHAGTSPSTAWVTIGKALGAAGMGWGDTTYIGAGIYRECVVVGLPTTRVDIWVDTLNGDATILDMDGNVFTQTYVGFTVTGSGIPVGATIVSVVDHVSAELSAAATADDEVAVTFSPPPSETFVIGDVDGAQTGDAGEVRLTSWITDDTTFPAVNTQALHLNGRSHLTFERLRIVGTYSPDRLAISLQVAGGRYPTNVTFRDCSIRGMTQGENAAGTSVSWLFDRCFMFSPRRVLELYARRGAGSHYDIGVAFQNCVMITTTSFSNLFFTDTDGSGTGKAGGVRFLNCTLLGSSIKVDVNLSTTIPLLLTNCRLVVALIAAEAGQIVEDYNVFVDGRSADSVNVSNGAHSTAYAANLMSIGDESVWGAAIRAFGVPGVGDPAIGFGGISPQAVDIVGAPRIAAFAAAGAYERGNTFTRETGTARSGSNAISITGPGYQDFDVPVDGATTITVYVRWDATYAGTKPAMQVLNGTECGVADATATATGSADSWEQLSLNFTPSAPGIVTIRFLSSDTNGGGGMFVDDYNVS